MIIRGTPMPHKLTLVSNALCPFVQRAIIVALEKGVTHERIYIDLSNKPDWFLKLSPTGKVPLLQVDDTVLFESVVIAEYLDETSAGRLHPEDALQRARHRAWIEYATGLLGDVFMMSIAADEAAFGAKRDALAAKFDVLERNLDATGPWFDGAHFHLVDAMFAPVFRYFDALDRYVEHGLFATRPRLAAWRVALAARPSVRDSVPPDYVAQYVAAQRKRTSWLGQRVNATER
jgi:glutathione S-transferase